MSFAKEGARGVVVADLNTDGSKETVAQAKAVATNPNFQAEVVEVDVASEESVKAAVARTVELFGRIDYAIHSAGVSSLRCDWLWNVQVLSVPDFKQRSPEAPLILLRKQALPISSTCLRFTSTELSLWTGISRPR